MDNDPDTSTVAAQPNTRITGGNQQAAKEVERKADHRPLGGAGSGSRLSQWTLGQRARLNRRGPLPPGSHEVHEVLEVAHVVGYASPPEVVDKGPQPLLLHSHEDDRSRLHRMMDG